MFLSSLKIGLFSCLVLTQLNTSCELRKDQSSSTIEKTLQFEASKFEGFENVQVAQGIDGKIMIEFLFNNDILFEDHLDYAISSALSRIDFSMPAFKRINSVNVLYEMKGELKKQMTLKILDIENLSRSNRLKGKFYELMLYIINDVDHESLIVFDQLLNEVVYYQEATQMTFLELCYILNVGKKEEKKHAKDSIILLELLLKSKPDKFSKEINVLSLLLEKSG